MKQVIAARSDLGMSPGKLAAQGAHASILAYEAADPEVRETWRREGQKKVVVKVRGESALRDLAEQGHRSGLPCRLVEDQGLTQLEPGTPTVVGIGPAPDHEIDRLTGDLSLY
jgi:PTH2 family peptidyl-tRNA hydrolase